MQLKCCYAANNIGVAIGKVIESYFAKQPLEFDIITHVNSSEVKDLVEITLSSANIVAAKKIIKMNDLRTLWRFQSAIWFFDSFELFWKSRSVLDFSQVGSTKIRNLIYCGEKSEDKIEQHFRKAEESAEYEYLGTRGNDKNFPLWWTFVIEQDNALYLKSITLFSPQHCGQIKLVEINKFSNQLMSWTTEDFFHVDISNFYGCQLVFGFSKRFSGVAYHIMKSIAKSLNFSIALNQLNSSMDIYEDKSLNVIQFLFNQCIDQASVHNFHMSASLYNSFVSLTVPYGAPFTPLEIMFYPFDNYVWFFFVITFLFAYLIISVIHLFGHIKTAKLIFGPKVQTPALNVFSIFMGNAMTMLPRKNFARFLLMSFTLFCLIMR